MILYDWKLLPHNAGSDVYSDFLISFDEQQAKVLLGSSLRSLEHDHPSINDMNRTKDLQMMGMN